jgi:uncharacterized membrane protein
MILHISPDAPAIVKLAAASVLYVHIGAAFIGLGSGFAAMLTRKGRKLHRLAGNVFFGSMMTMAGIGAAVAPFLPQRVSTVAALMTLYLVLTSWVTVRRRPNTAGRLEWVGMLLGACTVAAGGYLAWLGAQNGGQLDRLPSTPALIFAGFALLGLGGDAHLIRKGGLAGPPRMARHIWRMCVALLLATFSFAAQPAALPDAIEGSPLLFAPIVVLAGLTIYWLIKIRLKRPFKFLRGPASAGAAAGV